MYFWRLKPLKQELQRSPLAASEAVKYAIAYSIAFIGLEYVPIENEAFTLTDALLLLVTLAITVAGISFVYRANGGAGGADFPGRYLALGWVVGVRILVFGLLVLAAILTLIFIAVFVSALLAERELPELPDAWLEGAGITFTLGVYLLYYWRLGLHMRDLASSTMPERDSS